MKKNILVSLLFVVGISGCSTIHFDKGEPVLAQQKNEKWHHIFAFALYEGSPVVNLKNECGRTEWVSVKTETSLINGVAGGVVNIAGPIWYPKTVEVSCD